MSLTGDNVSTARPSATSDENIHERIHQQMQDCFQIFELSRGWRQKAEIKSSSGLTGNKATLLELEKWKS